MMLLSIAVGRLLAAPDVLRSSCLVCILDLVLTLGISTFNNLLTLIICYNPLLLIPALFFRTKPCVSFA